MIIITNQIRMLNNFASIFVRALNQKKVSFPTPDEQRDFLNALIEFAAKIYIEDEDLTHSSRLCVQKLLLGIGSYEGKCVELKEMLNHGLFKRSDLHRLSSFIKSCWLY